MSQPVASSAGAVLTEFYLCPCCCCCCCLCFCSHTRQTVKLTALAVACVCVSNCIARNCNSIANFAVLTHRQLCRWPRAARQEMSSWSFWSFLVPRGAILMPAVVGSEVLPRRRFRLCCHASYGIFAELVIEFLLSIES